MTNNDNAIKSILDGVNILVDKKFKKSPILETGVITAIGTKGYTVKVNNIEYNNINTIGGTCSINETVKVGIPYGNYSRMFIIKGGSGGGVSGVTSVNGKTGEVVLTAGDIGAQPSGNYATISQLSTETANRIDSDTTLQTQINTLQSKSDVVDIVGTYAELQTYDTSKLGNNDIIKVLEDSTHNNNATYYRWSTTTNTFTYIGQEIDSGTIVTVGGVNQDTWDSDIKLDVNGDASNVTNTFIEQPSQVLTSGEKLSISLGKIKLAISNLINHIANISNPHNVTKSQVGLGDIPNSVDTTIGGTKDSSSLITSGAVNGIKIGGINLLKNTLNPTYYIYGENASETFASLALEKGKISVNGEGRVNCWNALMANYSTIDMSSLTIGDEYVFSMDIRTTNLTKNGLYLKYDFRLPLNISVAEILPNKNGEWQRLSCIVKIKSALTSNYQMALVIASTKDNITWDIGFNGVIIEYKNMKLEQGNKPTSWSPAPEDKLDVTANAVSATKLQTPRNINGVAFNGTRDVKSNLLYAEQITGKTLDLNSLTANSKYYGIHLYICGTDGGSSNILNKPYTRMEGFLLKVEQLRFYGTEADFITKQTLETARSFTTYIRYCTNGSWSSWIDQSNNGISTKAMQDSNGNVITSTYGASLKISGQTVSLVSKSGTTLSSVTVPMGVMVWQ